MKLVIQFLARIFAEIFKKKSVFFHRKLQEVSNFSHLSLNLPEVNTLKTLTNSASPHAGVNLRLRFFKKFLGSKCCRFLANINR